VFQGPQHALPHHSRKHGEKKAIELKLNF